MNQHVGENDGKSLSTALPVNFLAHERNKPFFVPIYPQHTMKIHETLTIFASKKMAFNEPPPPLSSLSKTFRFPVHELTRRSSPGWKTLAIPAFRKSRVSDS